MKIELGKLAKEKKLFGMLETTWHVWHDSRYQIVLGEAATAAWNPDAISEATSDAQRDTRLAMALHLRQAAAPMKLTEYKKFGFAQKQVNAGESPE